MSDNTARSGAGRSVPEATEADFRALAENAPDAFIVAGDDDVIRYANPCAHRMLGYDAGELEGRPVVTILAAEERERVLRIRADRRAGRPVPVHYEANLMAADGARVPIEVAARETTWRGGRADVVVLRDIRERLEAGKELRRRDAVLEAVGFAAARLLASREWEERLGEMLQRLAQALGVERAYVWRTEPRADGEILTWRTYGWGDNPAEGEIDSPLQGKLAMRAVGLADWADALLAGEPVVRALEGYPQPIRRALERRGVRSLALVPIGADEGPWGTLGFSDTRQARVWSPLEIDSLRTAANILGGVIRLRQAEDRLRESEEKYRSLVEGANQPIALVDRSGVYHFANNRAAADLGLSAPEVPGRSLAEFFPPEEATARTRRVAEALDAGRLVVDQYETTVQGTRRWYESRIQPLGKEAGGPDRALILATDVTERIETEKRIRAYQKRLQSLTSELVLTEQRERRRIASELHDRIGQSLAISKMKLSALRTGAVDPATRATLDEVARLLEQTIADTRSLTFELSPPVLHELGLEAALEWLVDRFRGQHGIRALFQDDGKEKPLDPDRRGILFHAVQEVLLNTAKHSGASMVRVAVERSDGSIRITVHDNGRGFEVAAERPGQRDGFGLFSIRERITHLGGAIDLHSEADHGTTVILTAPLRIPEGAHGEVE